MMLPASEMRILASTLKLSKLLSLILLLISLVLIATRRITLMPAAFFRMPWIPKSTMALYANATTLTSCLTLQFHLRSRLMLRARMLLLVSSHRSCHYTLTERRRQKERIQIMTVMKMRQLFSKILMRKEMIAR